ncbi:MAG: electron transport complex subunit RsxC [Candidatus Omnitrophica bacterium]|nr:electron transport complex subunit RsxC [Candidatus Omnitrophota bacterium]
MLLKSFKGGVHPRYFKDLTSGKSIRKIDPPDRFIIPLIQHTGGPCAPLVGVGDLVKKGQLIGKSDKYISSCVHASTSGKVVLIDKAPHPILGKAQAITIEADGRDEGVKDFSKVRDMGEISPDEIRRKIEEAGIVGLGGAAFPTHVKMTIPENKKVDTIILNGAECEPYLTCDGRLMVERPKDILEGLGLMARAIGVDRAIIAIEDNKPEAIASIEKALQNTQYKIRDTKVVTLATKYPQGGEKQLIAASLGREVPPCGLPFDVGVVVSNAGTALAVYEAISKDKPLFERVVTVSGDCIKEPSNLLVRIGTPIKALIDACGGFKKRPKRLIMGGPMMGVAQTSTEVPVIKGTSGILALSGEFTGGREEGPCIRCARCVDVCPMRLLPTDIVRLARKARYEDAKGLNISDCMECGACTHECPARIPLVQWIRLGKMNIPKG